MKEQPVQAAVRTLLIALLATLFVGCATRKVDWAGRVGSYTFDQAVMDFGPPDKQAKLTDGTTVAEWLTRRGSNRLYASPAHYPYWAGPAYPTYMDTYSPDHFLRLVFDANGKLTAWKNYVR